MKNVFTLPYRLAQQGIREGSQLDIIIKRFKANKIGMVGLGLLLLYMSFALVGPYLVLQNPTEHHVTERLSAPSSEHPFGTDQFGRDVYSRILIGARANLAVSVLVVSISSLHGVSLGLLAGFSGGRIDEAIMRTVDFLLAFPHVLLALVIIAILGPGLNRAIIALSIAYTPPMIRITRGSAISIREEEYILASISYGESKLNIMFREMLPNVMSAVMVQLTITFAFTTLVEAGLSYLGLSAQPPTITWGVMIAEGQGVLEIAPWASVFPGLAIMITVLGLTFFGIGLRDALDPKTDIPIGV